MATLPNVFPNSASGYARTPITGYKFGNRLPDWVNIPDPSKSTFDNSSAIGVSDKQNTFNAEGGVLPIVYGRQRLGSKIIAINGMGLLTLGVAFCEGPIHSIESLELNDISVSDTTYVGKITIAETYLGNQVTASPTLSIWYAPYGYADVLPNTVYAVLQLGPSTSSGFPIVTAEVKGMKVYDPRDTDQTHGVSTTYKWSDNPALCLADLINSTRYGLGADVDWASVAEVANYNDKLVGSPLEKSKTLNIILDAQQSTSAWIETLRGYASCFVVPSDNGYKLVPDRPIGYGFSCIGNTNTYTEVPYNVLYDLGNELSLEFSIKPNILGTGTGTILAKSTDYKIDYIYPTGTVAGTISFAYTDTVHGLQTILIEDAELSSTTQYTTVSISLNKNTVVQACVNGVEKTLGITFTATNTASIQNTVSTPIYIGKNITVTPFYGVIDEIRLWNRCRTLDEMQRDYNRFIYSNRDSSLFLHLPFNEGYPSYSGATTLVANYTIRDATGIASAITAISPSATPWVQHDGEYDFFRFDGNNVLAGTTKFKKRGISSIPTVIEITYTNTDNKPWREDYARLNKAIDHDGKERLSTIPMLGITRHSQAMREAIERYNAIVSDTTITFSALDETLGVTVGSPIQFHHPVIEVPGTNFFKPYRITSLKQKGDGRWDLGAIEYDPANYSETVVTQETFADSNFPRLDSPTEIDSHGTPEEFLGQGQDGLWTSRVRLTFTPSNYPYTDGFRIGLYKYDHTKIEEKDILVKSINLGSTITYVSSPGLNLVVNDPPVPIQYYIKIQTIAPLAVSTGVQTELFTVLGKTAIPGNVPEVRGFEAQGAVYLNWDEAVDIDIWRYRVRQGPYNTATGAESIETQWDEADEVNIVDGRTYTAYFIPTGTRRFFVKAIDSVRNESAAAAWVDIEVDKDDNAFTLGTTAVSCNTAASANVSSFTMRPDPKTYWITDYGGTWNTDGDVLSNPLTDSVGSLVVPIPHASAYTTWTTQHADFGVPASGGFYSGYVTVTSDLVSLSGEVNDYIEYSTDAVSWSTAAGTSAVVTGRYVRYKVQGDATAGTTASHSSFIVSDGVTIKFDIIVREETGTVVTNGTTNVGVVSLSRIYNLAKTIQLTVQGTGSNNYSVVYDNVLLGSGNNPNTFDVYVINTSNTKVAGQTVSWLFKGI